MGASRTTKPFTAHPAFPVVVALWFAALLGLGTFVVPPANFEGLVVGTGLDGLIPAAAPPLGATARIAISAMAALLGAALGLAIAARIRRSEDEPQTESEIAAPAADSLWLADGDSAAAQNYSGETPAGATELDERAASESPGTIPTRLARRQSTIDRDDLQSAEPVDEGADEGAEEHSARIFQASDLALGDTADASALAAEESGTHAADEDDDLQRFAADRLVAGLPRVPSRNFDENPLEDWSHPDPLIEQSDGEAEADTEFAAVPEPIAKVPEEVEPEDRDCDGPDSDDSDFRESDSGGPDFDGADSDGAEPIAVSQYEDLSAEPAPRFEDKFASADYPEPPEHEWSPAVGDAAAETSWATDVGMDAEFETGPRDFSASSLSELVARFDAALAAQRLPSQSDHAEQEPQRDSSQADDPVIAFLRREADRDRGTPSAPPHGQPDDPRAVLRNALDKLDRVSRKS